MASVTLTGLKELDDALKAFEPSVRKQIARKAARAAAKPVLETAREEVNRDSGDLQRSLKIRALKRSRKNKHIVGVRVVTGEDFFKGNQFYGAFIEFGTSKMKARPFLRPAHDRNRGTVMAIFQEKIRQIIKDKAGK